MNDVAPNFFRQAPAGLSQQRATFDCHHNFGSSGLAPEYIALLTSPYSSEFYLFPLVTSACVKARGGKSRVGTAIAATAAALEVLHHLVKPRWTTSPCIGRPWLVTAAACASSSPPGSTATPPTCGAAPPSTAPPNRPTAPRSTPTSSSPPPARASAPRTWKATHRCTSRRPAGRRRPSSTSSRRSRAWRSAASTATLRSTAPSVSCPWPPNPSSWSPTRMRPPSTAMETPTPSDVMGVLPDGRDIENKPDPLVAEGITPCSRPRPSSAGPASGSAVGGSSCSGPGARPKPRWSSRRPPGPDAWCS